MEKFLEAAKIAWNPVGASRQRMRDGTFTLLSMLVPYIGIVITCNLLGIAAQNFFYDSMFYALGGEMPDHPFLQNDFVQKFLSAFQVLVPLAAIAILPSAMFWPSTRSAVLATVLAVAAALAFYGAAMGMPVYVFAGLVASGDPQAGIALLLMLVIPTAIVQLVLLFVFWFRITGSILGISGGKSFVILLVGAIPLGLLILLIVATIPK